MFVRCIEFNRKRRLSIVIASVLLLAVAFSAVAVTSYAAGRTVSVSGGAVERTVIIDAGHGGEDGGAVGVNGAYEKDIDLALAMLIGQGLEEQGINVIYTRTEDKMLYLPEENIKGIRKLSDLKQRCLIAKNNPDAIFVSIHLNSYAQEKYSGLEVYYSENTPESLLIAESIRASVVRDLQPDNKRTLKRGADIYLLENISTPAVLVECGFLSNPEECEKLSEKEYQKSLSFSIVCGIIEYIRQSGS